MIKSKSPVEKQKLGIGVIGAGMISQVAHLPAIRQVVGMNILGIADFNAKMAADVGKTHGVKRAYPHHSDLLQVADIEGVVAVVHRKMTAGVVKDSLLSGKHTLSEKPMAMTLPAARELVSLAEAKQVIYAVGFMKRYDAGVRRGKSILVDLLASQRLGRLLHVRGKNFCAEYVGHFEDYIRGNKNTAVTTKPSYPTVPDWLKPEWIPKYDWFANVGLHTVNLLRYLVDDQLSLRHADFSYEKTATVMFDASGVPISLDFGRSATAKWEESFEFFFERGRLELQLTSLKQRDRCAAVTLDENFEEAKTSYWGHDTHEPWCFIRQMQAFADAIRGNLTDLVTSGKDCLRDMELLEKIFLHVQTKKNE